MCLVLVLLLMLSLSFKCPPVTEVPVISGFVNHVEKEDANGKVVLVPCPDPYEGLSADSFELDAQIEAGVPLQHISPISTGSISEIDRNNVEAEKFINSFKNQSNNS